MNHRGRGRWRGRGGYFDRVNEGPWNPEKGFKDALKQIKSLKDAGGDLGVGMEQVLELVNNIIAEDEGNFSPELF
jgi:hypothetical protein